MRGKVTPMIGILIVVIFSLIVDVAYTTEETLKREAMDKLSQVKVAILYQKVTDGTYYLNRDVDDVINILKETETDFIFRGWWRKYPCIESTVIRSDFFPVEYIEESIRRGYTYEELRNAIAKIKSELPDVIFCGAVTCQWINKREQDPITGETFDIDKTWAMALDPRKWNISISKEEFQERFARKLQWIGADEKYEHTKVWAYFPDITNPNFQKLVIDLAKKQIDCGADAIWLDYLFNQAQYLAKITENPHHPAVIESIEAASKIVDEIHNYGYSKGKYILVGSWPSFVDFPYPPPDLDFVTITPSSAEVYLMTLDENYWNTRIKKIREKLGNVPIFAYMDLGQENLPLTVFAQELTPDKQREFLEYVDDFFQRRGVNFIYPVHGGWFGKNPKILAFGKFNVYDSLAPEFQTYDTIRKLAQKRAKIEPTLIVPQRSYVKVVDGNPTLFVGEEPLDIIGLRTTSDPYKSDESYQNVIEYIDKAAKYGYKYVTVKLSWYQMDRTEHNTFPKPEDVGKLMDWKRLDEIFDYASSRNVYIIPFFWHNIPPQWWFDLTPNYKDFLQTSDNGKTVPMMSFNVPNFQKYEDEAIRAIINRYKNHPAYLGFLLQFGFSNEDNYPGTPYMRGWFDYSTFSKNRFREWLKRRYNYNVSNLQRAWNKPSVNFGNAEPPKPLPDIADPIEMIDWINSGGDSRREFYDWQLFRLEEKRRARKHLIDVVKTADPDHVLIMTSPSVGGGLLFINSLALDYDDYLSERVDIVHSNPGIHKTWDIMAKGANYSFVKYFETRGKAVFIKWESRPDLSPDNIDELRKRALFARRTGSGIALWENKILTFPEFTDEQIKATAETFYSVPEGKLRRSEFAIIDDTFSKSFDYRKGIGKLRMYSHFKIADRAMLRGLLYLAGLDFDVITTNEILSNPDILRNYKAVALSNLYRLNDKLLKILIDYRDSGGGIFVQGRTGLYNRYGKRELRYLKQLLGISSAIREYKVTSYSWTYSDADEPLLKGISGKRGDRKSKYNVYYIPVFDYEKEGYRILGYLDSNSRVATVGYKGKVVFWFPRLGTQVLDLSERELEITEQFLRNLYKFYGIQDRFSGEISQVKVAVQYRYVTDGKVMNRGLDDVIRILKDTGGDFIFQGWMTQKPCPDRCSDLLTRREREICHLSGYSYAHLMEAVSKVKRELPGIIFCGGTQAEYLYPEEVGNSRLILEPEDRDRAWNMALNPAKWGISVSRRDIQCFWAKRWGDIPRDERCPSEDELKKRMRKFFPDLTDTEFQEIFLDRIYRQIDAGVDAIWIDMLYMQGRLMEELTGDPEHLAVRESYEAAKKLVDKIHEYGMRKGKYIYVITWVAVKGRDSIISVPREYVNVDAAMVSPSPDEIKDKSTGKIANFNEKLWDELVERIREEYGIPIFARIDYGGPGRTQLYVFSQELSVDEAREFLEKADKFFSERGIIFIYPLHGGDMGRRNLLRKLSYGKFNWYDSLAPEFKTYEIIRELAQRKRSK